MSGRAARLRDETLILEYRSGDKGALERLISGWQPRVYWYILVTLQDENAAWDVYNKAISHLRKKGLLNEREAALPEIVEQPDDADGDPVCNAEDAQLVVNPLVALFEPSGSCPRNPIPGGTALDQILKRRIERTLTERFRNERVSQVFVPNPADVTVRGTDRH